MPAITAHTAACLPAQEASLTGCQQLSFDEFAKRYCEYSTMEKQHLLLALDSQKKKYHPYGWMMLECQMLDSSRCGHLTILPYGPQNTWTSIPSGPVSPRGLASDMSVVVASLSAHDPVLLRHIAEMRQAEEPI